MKATTTTMRVFVAWHYKIIQRKSKEHPKNPPLLHSQRLMELRLVSIQNVKPVLELPSPTKRVIPKSFKISLILPSVCVCLCMPPFALFRKHDVPKEATMNRLAQPPRVRLHNKVAEPSPRHYIFNSFDWQAPTTKSASFQVPFRDSSRILPWF